ncbi:MAG TPA: sn-glycerol-3-phosphate ABC transporter ATP-binding protein UgpC [Devosiaceae bacterium]
MGQLELRDVRKSYGSVEVIKGVSLDVPHGKFVVFVGPSGCGKSTLLRMIAGLEEITRGDVRIDDKVVNDLPPVRRGIAMVFQSYALYPHMSVFENIAFPLRVERLAQAQVQEKVERAADILQLRDRLEHKPGQLSGGQRQRVAIGRAIVREPSVFLFDEPLSNLDAALRSDMRVELAKLHRDLDATMIYVTHDQVEAMTMADTIVVLNRGLIAQQGSPLELYHRPENLFVAGFIGNPRMNILPAECTGVSDRGVTVKVRGIEGEITVAVEPKAGLEGQQVLLGIRPEHVAVGQGDMALTINPNVVEHLGIHTVAYAAVGAADTPFCALLPGSLPVRESEPFKVTIRGSDCHLFDTDGNALMRRVELTEIDASLLGATTQA